RGWPGPPPTPAPRRLPSTARTVSRSPASPCRRGTGRRSSPAWFWCGSSCSGRWWSTTRSSRWPTRSTARWPTAGGCCCSSCWSALPMLLQLLVGVMFVVVQFGALFWFLSRGGVETYFPDDIKTRFSDVWGQDAVVERVKESILFLEAPEAIEAKGGYVPGGLLLWGPPGTGKTLMAEAVAGETGKPYVFVDPGAFIQMFMGVGVLKVKSLFRKLRKLAVRY